MTASELFAKTKSWVVIGVSTNPEKYGYKIFKHLKSLGHKVYGISDRHESLDGVKLYSSIIELPGTPDTAVFVINPEIGIDYITDCAGGGIEYLWFQPGASDDEILNSASYEGLEYVLGCVLEESEKANQAALSI